MNKESPEYTRVREKIAKEVAIIRGLIRWDELPDDKVEEIFSRSSPNHRVIINGYASKEGCFEYADQILSIKGIAILSDDYNLLGKWVRFTRLATNADEQDEFFHLPLSSTNFRRVI